MRSSSIPRSGDAPKSRSSACSSSRNSTFLPFGGAEMRRQSLMLFALLVSMAGLEASAQGTGFVEQPEHWGKGSRIVRPEDPPEALKNPATGAGDIEGGGEGSGRLSGGSYKPRAGGSAAFVASLRE